MNYKTKTVEGKLVAEVTLEVEVPKHWIEHCLSSDVFRSDYSGQWARGVEFDEKLGWLVFDEEHSDAFDTAWEHETGREEALRAWRGLVVGATATLSTEYDTAYADYNGQSCEVVAVDDANLAEDESPQYTIRFANGKIFGGVFDAELDCGSLPKGWYRLDEAAAVKAYLHGVQRWGEGWMEHPNCDGRWYDIVLQLALLGEIRYG